MVWCGSEKIMSAPNPSVDPYARAAEPRVVPEDADRLVAEGIAAMERGDEIDQEELFAKWRVKYG